LNILYFGILNISNWPIYPVNLKGFEKILTDLGLKSVCVLKASRRDFRNKLMRQKKNMRENQDFKAAYPDVFMVEHLTPMRSKVAYKLRHDATQALKSAGP